MSSTLFILSALLLAAGVLFLARGDIVHNDPVASYWLKVLFAASLFGASLTMGFCGYKLSRSTMIPPPPPPFPTNVPPALLPITNVPPSVSNHVFRLSGRVIHQDLESPIIGARVSLEGRGTPTLTKNTGTYELLCSKEPREEEAIRVEHEAYLTQFSRYDDLLINRGEVALKPKVRVIVVEFQGTKTNQPYVRYGSSIRKNLEGQLQGSGGIILLPEGKRDEIVRQLYVNQEQRALYDPKTLAKVGSFLGATHGVFGSVSKGRDAIYFECQLVALEKGTVVVTAKFPLAADQADEEALIEYGSTHLANLLISKLTEIKILQPKAKSNCGYQVVVRGYAVCLPPDWTPWVTLVPEGNKFHYPQDRITVASDRSWIASSVYVGEKGAVIKPSVFNIYVVLTAPKFSLQIEKYIRDGNSQGLDMNSWGDEYCRIFESPVPVTRLDRN